jgi:hypothetical protein
MKIEPRLTTVMVAFLFLLSVATIAAQKEVEQAPTVGQCQIDQAKWQATLESGDGGADHVTFPTLLSWHKEADQCLAVEPKNLNKYARTRDRLTAAMFLRQYHFLQRHRLLEKFYAEDEEGKR